jgi:nucleoside-diphosphate-sugar epimerase
VLGAARGCDAIIHTAARTGVWGAYGEYYDTNVVGTRNVIDVCRELGISRLVYTSSPSVIFDGNDMEGADESVPNPGHHDAHYPATKAEAERTVLAANDEALATVALRPHLIWGPGDPHLVARIVQRGKSGKLRRIGKREKKIDSVFVDNAAHAHVLALDRLHPGSPIGGKVYFITNGQPMPVWDLVNRILGAAGVPPVTGSIPARLAYTTGVLLEFLHSLFRIEQEPFMTRFVARELSTSHWFDISAARRDLGYIPEISIEEGIRMLTEWFDRGG